MVSAFVWAVLVVGPVWAQCDLDFDAARTYPVGARPFSVARGDFNADGIEDLATANHDAASVTVLLGNGTGDLGDGTFTPNATYLTADGPRYILTADFNEDGILDLAVTHNFDDVVSILIGNGVAGQGDGTFGPPDHYAVAAGPTWLAAGDFNADDILDLVSAGLFSNHLSVLLGNGSAGVGDGTFTRDADYAAGSGPNSVTTSDLDSDGILDLAVANMTGDRVLIFLGDGTLGQGDGTFTLSNSYVTPSGTACVVAEDFNGDEIRDIAASNYFDDTVSILIGNGTGGQGDGTFQNSVDYPAGHGPPAFTADYLDDDAFLDLAVINYHDDAVSILLGNGDGSFQLPIPYAVGDGPEFVRSGDYDEDGTRDLAVVSAWSDNVAVLLGETGNPGTFRSADPLDAGRSPMDVVAADFNEDGFPDLAVADSLVNRVRVLINDATTGGSFLPKVGYLTGISPVAIASGDFDEDGILDLAAADYVDDAVSILLGDGAGGVGDGTFQPSTEFTAGNGPRDLIVEDFNEDGILDIATANRPGQGISVLLGQGVAGVGDGTFATPTICPVGLACVALATGDFDEDDILDLAVATRGTGEICILLGNGSGGTGDGTFQSPARFPAGTAPSAIAAAFLDSDTHMDLAVACESADSVSVLLGSGDGSFGSLFRVGVIGGPRGLEVMDLNRDGLPELITANGSTCNLSVIRADSTTESLNYLLEMDLGAAQDPAAVTSCDFNDDDLPDLVSADEGSETVSILMNASGCGTTLVAGPGIDLEHWQQIHALPNPLGHETLFRFSVPERGVCRVAIFDATGRRVRDLLDKDVERGLQEIRWNGCNNRGERVSAGVYFCRVLGPSYRGVGKLVVIR
jgi:hypothetical protein